VGNIGKGYRYVPPLRSGPGSGNGANSGGTEADKRAESKNYGETDPDVWDKIQQACSNRQDEDESE